MSFVSRPLGRAEHDSWLLGALEAARQGFRTVRPRRSQPADRRTYTRSLGDNFVLSIAESEGAVPCVT